ncbi:MAG: DJ-1/PfpI family protein, partial [Lentisphaeria bacterium]|nr:DJ-1/PfpI family protein [Lentisphaeria bacterium]
MNRKQAVILLADGFEETEAVATGDVLKRLGIAVQFAGVNTEYVTSTAGVTIKAHTLLADVDWSTKDAVILPGGLPGAENLRDSSEVMEILRKMNADGKVVAAICAAPIALERAGLVRGKTVTGYPGTNAGLEDLIYTGNRAEQ